MREVGEYVKGKSVSMKSPARCQAVFADAAIPTTNVEWDVLSNSTEHDVSIKFRRKCVPTHTHAHLPWHKNRDNTPEVSIEIHQIFEQCRECSLRI